MAIVFTAQTVFTDPNLPKLKVDQIMPNAGALLLWKPSLIPDFTVPANNGTMENLAWEQAAAMIAGATKETLAVLLQSTFSSAASGKAEKSTKGGIHVINSQTVSAQGQGFDARAADLIRGYIAANPTHQYFMSIWGRTTRATLDAANQYAQAGISSASPNNTNLITLLTNAINPPSSNPAYLGHRRTGNFNAIGSFLYNAGAAGFIGATAPTLATLLAYFQIGSKDPYKSFNVNKAASGVMYKWYIEDLTVSGRTYAEVDAIDNALYTAAFAAGGEYNGDTWPTNPSTIA